MRIIIMLIAIMAAAPASALTCVEQPSCAELNYTERSCDGAYLECPYDSSWKNCTEDCTGYNLSSCPAHCNCSEGCGKYRITSAQSGYVVSGNTCTEECNPSASCKWTSSNAGHANLSNQCCDGTYATCTSTCKEVTNLPRNAHGITPCTGCGQEVYTDWDCDNGYHKSGSTCEQDTDCSSYTLDSCPSNCNCDSCGGKYKITSADSGYKQSGNQCVCATTCTAVTIPSNATCSKKCSACGSAEVCTEWSCNSGYHEENGGCEKDTDCSAYTLDSCPTGCNCSSCDNGKYKIDSAKDGYNKGTTTCPVASCPGDSSTNSSTSVCGSERYWSRDKNGSKSGTNDCYDCSCNAPSSCEWLSSNAGTATLSNQCCDGWYETCTSNCGSKVTPPSHASCSETCSACGSAEICVDWQCDSGYTQSGSNCVCAKTCAEVAVPTNATCSETCSACGSAEVCVDWECNSGYKQSGNSCEKEEVPCQSGYAEHWSDCGPDVQHGQRYLGTKTQATNPKCKECLIGCDQEYELQGEACVKEECPDGYVEEYRLQSVDDCGRTGRMGWELVSNGSANGWHCVKCSPLGCPHGSSTTCTGQGSQDYSGDDRCYDCLGQCAADEIDDGHGGCRCKTAAEAGCNVGMGMQTVWVCLPGRCCFCWTNHICCDGTMDYTYVCNGACKDRDTGNNCVKETCY